jgi:hypothetical protein
MPSHARTPTDRFYDPGRRFLRWLEQAGLGRDHPLAYFSAPVLVGIAWVWFVVDGTVWSTIGIASAVLYQGLTSYLSGADTLARRDVHQEVWNRIKTLNTDTMGHMAILLRYYRERFVAEPGMEPVEFRVGMTHLQQHLLRHLVDVIAEHLGLSEKYELSANWALPEADDRGRWFRPRVYDRNMPDRQPFPFRRYPIDGNAPGAARAFLTGELAFVPDTAAPDAAEHFRPNAPYRCTLAFPVNSGDQVVGVVNVDARHAHQLTPDLEYLIRHIAYVIGLCESFKETAYAPHRGAEPAPPAPPAGVEHRRALEARTAAEPDPGNNGNGSHGSGRVHPLPARAQQPQEGA